MTKRRGPKRKVSKRERVFKPIADADWWAERFDDAGMSQNDVARQLALHPGSLSKIFSGQQRLGTEKWLELAALLRVPVVTALRRGGYKVPETRVPIEGYILGTARVSYGIQGESTAAVSDDPNTKALLFNVSDGPLLGFDGMVLYYRPSGSTDPEAFGRTSVVLLHGESTPVVGTLHRRAGGKLRLTLLNGETIEAPRVITASPAERIVRRE